MISLPITLHVMEGDGHVVLVPSVFRYDDSDPYAVALHMAPPRGHPVTWTMARDLLIEGVIRPAGQGDVALRPCRDGALEIALYSPEGEAVLYADVLTVSTFLTLTCAAVPRGKESDHIDIGAELARLFGEAA